MTKKDVEDLVEKYLKGHQPDNFNLMVLSEGTRQDGNWWYVLVRPDKTISPEEYRNYYLILGDVEQEISEKEEEQVLLVPVQAD